MKRLVALIMCAVSLGAAAQIDWDFPYNPDGNNDGYIFSEDLLDLLAVYGQEFNSEEFYLSHDSSRLIVFVGEMLLAPCISACDELQGFWQIPNHVELSYFYDELRIEVGGLSEEEVQVIWSLEDEADRSRFNQYIGVIRQPYNSAPSMHGEAGSSLSSPRECWCATKQRPRVEFDRVNALPIPEWAEFLNQKASEGWYILPQPVPATDTQSVTFWRWAE